jgi:hypothetical protein
MIYAVDYPFLLTILDHAPYSAMTLSKFSLIYLISIKMAIKKYMVALFIGYQDLS